MPDLIDHLKFRGLFYQCTDEASLRAHLGQAPRRVYCGFDPTADSLTIGNLVPIMALRQFQLAGHTPVVIMGGGTGLIGDPSGKSAERQLQSEETVQRNVESQMRIFRSILDFSPNLPNRALIVNNAEWLRKLGFVEVLRTIGKHLSVNEMIKRDSVRDRLEREQGISYTEFSYLVLQAFDFVFLFQRMGVTVQIGGSDQWGNIVAGVDLIKKGAEIAAESAVKEAVMSGVAASRGDVNEAMSHAEKSMQAMGRAQQNQTFGMTLPLVTKADGGKFGKSESGAVWLTPERTSPYAFYQFWLNSDDADVLRFLRLFTLMPPQQVAELERVHAADPARREAHRALARHMTALLHGEPALREAEAAAGALFGGGETTDFTALSPAALAQLFAAAPATEHPRSLLSGDGITLLDLLPQTSLAKSKTEARQHLQAGAVSVNGRPVAADARLRVSDLLHNEIALLRRGKKTWHVTRWT